MNCQFSFICSSIYQLIPLSTHIVSPSNDPSILSPIYPFFLSNLYWVPILCRIVVWHFVEEWRELNTVHKVLSMTYNNGYDNFRLSMKLLSGLYYWCTTVFLSCAYVEIFFYVCFPLPKFRDHVKDGFLNLIRAVWWFSLEKRPPVNTQSKCYNSVSPQWTNGWRSACIFQKSLEEKKAKSW